ncbi:MAG TPA: PBP1A family penicillin-binding protein [Terriglobia bacterium]|nr:PBP1A family penicillin-binding protein [Terriglobia bacterium]
MRAKRKRAPLRVAAWAWWKKLLVIAGLAAIVAGVGIFVYLDVHFSRMINARLSGSVFNHASLVYATPTPVHVGERATAEGFAARLQRAGYESSGKSSPLGDYQIEGDKLVIRPGPASFFHGPAIQEGPAVLSFHQGHVAAISDAAKGTALQDYWLEPEVITTLFGRSRAKRRVVKYQELPKVLDGAVIAAEDHRFFSHHGVNLLRILGAALADLRAQRAVQGGSTLTMQLARNFFLTPRRTIRRKVEEIFIALLLEHRLSKEKIFELYANEIYMGQRGSFSIYGFGEAANAYFNKDVSSLTLPEAALLAGMIRGPNFYSPYDHPGRALARRNHVLHEMVETGSVTRDQAAQAVAAPIGVTRENVEASQAPYFVDMIQGELLQHFSEEDLLSQSYRIYTTLDLDLQRTASEAVRTGMAEVDQRIGGRRRRKKPPEPRGPKEPQVALVVLDPHSGAVRALVGGRNYAESQLNHALAKRQPGSSFKPFVYAAALNSALDGSQPVITPATILTDEPTTFRFGDQVYAPRNYEDEYLGQVSVREALAHSLNVATVSLAQMVGYEKIKALAMEAGINNGLQATPAIALGAYVATPLEMAGSYTVFANSGLYEKPQLILAVNNDAGQTLYRDPQVSRQVLDPRVSYLMVSLMESVLDEGTGRGARTRGFTLPAAGKTGTSHDGWFSGFTSNLLAVVWVGYDNNRELNLAGASSALPVWTAFMKHATELPDYDDVEPFAEPAGMVSVPIDAQGKPVAENSPSKVRDEVFIQGTEPQAQNPLERVGGILGKFFHSNNPPNPPAGAAPPSHMPAPAPRKPQKPAVVETSPKPPQKKGGLLKKFFSIFKGGGSKHEPSNQNPP